MCCCKFSLAVILSLLFLALPARAGVLVTSLTAGKDYSFFTAGRETLADVGAGNPGSIGVGDVLYGFSDFRMYSYYRDAQGHLHAPTPNTVYTVFSEQVTSVSEVVTINKLGHATYRYNVAFGPTSAAGYTLSSLTGQAVNPQALFAFYDRSTAFPVGQGQFKGDLLYYQLPGAATIRDYVRFIAGHGTFEMSAGPKKLSDFFVAQGLPLQMPKNVVANPGLLNAMPKGQPLAGFSAALSVLDNRTGVTVGSTVSGQDPLAGPHQLWITQGNMHGDADARNAQNFTPAFGVRSDFTFGSTAAPEPSSLALAGLGAAGLAGWSLRRRRKVVAR
jgi:hypothetical protein